MKLDLTEAATAAKERINAPNTNDLAPTPWHWHDTFGRKDGLGDPIPKNALGQCSPFSFAVSALLDSPQCL